LVKLVATKQVLPLLENPFLMYRGIYQSILKVIGLS